MKKIFISMIDYIYGDNIIAHENLGIYNNASTCTSILDKYLKKLDNKLKKEHKKDRNFIYNDINYNIDVFSVEDNIKELFILMTYCNITSHKNEKHNKIEEINQARRYYFLTENEVKDFIHSAVDNEISILKNYDNSKDIEVEVVYCLEKWSIDFNLPTPIFVGSVDLSYDNNIEQREDNEIIYLTPDIFDFEVYNKIFLCPYLKLEEKLNIIK